MQLLTQIVLCTVISLLVYIAFHNIAFKNLYKRFKQYGKQHYGFYECGFRARHDLTAVYSLNNYAICSLVILYDVECVFLVIFLVGFNFISTLELVVFCLYVLLFLFGVVFEVFTKNTEWHFY